MSIFIVYCIFFFILYIVYWNCRASKVISLRYPNCV